MVPPEIFALSVALEFILAVSIFRQVLSLVTASDLACAVGADALLVLYWRLRARLMALVCISNRVSYFVAHF